jgi:hypothetical protein
MGWTMNDRCLNAQTTGGDGTNWVLRLAGDGSVRLSHKGEPFASVSAAAALRLCRATSSAIPRMRSLLDALQQDGGAPIHERACAALMENAPWLDDQFG